jgi:DtxR family Mn-dependent transcriptional regulator
MKFRKNPVLSDNLKNGGIEKMRVSDKAEEILEYMCIMTQEEDRDEISLNELETDKNAPEIKELLSLKYIDLTGGGITLRSEGVKEAESALRRHRLAERLITDVFDIKGDLMEETACAFEHLIRREVEESICTLLGHPKFCPHGKTISPGKCCKKSVKTAKSIVLSLADTKKGIKGKIAYLHTKEDKKLQKLMTMGFLPGVTIEVIQTFPSFIFNVGHSQIAVDKEMAGDIFIKPV